MNTTIPRGAVESNTTPVILVYAHGGRAAEMRLVESRQDEVTVRNPTTGAVIDLPRQLVYRYDQALFAKLTEAKETGRRDLLAALWSQAEQFDA